jgi:hypothetical protein
MQAGGGESSSRGECHFRRARILYFTTAARVARSAVYCGPAVDAERRRDRRLHCSSQHTRMHTRGCGHRSVVCGWTSEGVDCDWNLVWKLEARALTYALVFLVFVFDPLLIRVRSVYTATRYTVTAALAGPAWCPWSVGRPRVHTHAGSCRMRHSVCGAMCGSCVSGSGSCVMRCRWRSGDACRWRYDICRSGYGFMEPLPGGWVHLRARSRGGLPPPKDTCSSRWGVSPPPNLSSFPPCNPRAGDSAG